MDARSSYTEFVNAQADRDAQADRMALSAYQPPPASACRHERELALAEELRRQAIADQVTVAHHAFSGGPGYPFFCWCVGCETYRRGWWSRWGQLGAAVAGVVLAAVLGWCMGANDERLRQRREAAPVTTESLPR